MMSPTPSSSGKIEVQKGLYIRWESFGQGEAIVCCNGVGVSTFFWKYIKRQFSDRFQIILWDYRGHGASDRLPTPDFTDLSISTTADDLALVLEAAGAGPAVVVGHSMGCQVALELYAKKPELVRGLILMQGSAGRVLDTFFDLSISVYGHKLLLKAFDAAGDTGQRITKLLLNNGLSWQVTKLIRMVDPYYTKKEDFMPYLEHLASLDLRMFLRMVEEAHIHDCFPLLPNVEVPTLIVAAENDKFTPVWLSELMAQELPRSELLMLANGTHAALIEHPDTINHRIERFLSSELK
jgi:pimeloyl-ACP methyl ester carboxylesterase